MNGVLEPRYRQLLQRGYQTLVFRPGAWDLPFRQSHASLLKFIHIVGDDCGQETWRMPRILWTSLYSFSYWLAGHSIVLLIGRRKVDVVGLSTSS